MTRPSRARSQDERGFTLAELLVVILLISILTAFVATALQRFQRTQALEGAKDEVVTQLRGLQQRVISETHPLVYGARFKKNQSAWEVVQYNPETNVCTKVGEGFDFRGGVFRGGVTVEDADFDNYDVAGPGNITQKCRGSFTDVVFFFARGSATGGSVTVNHGVLGRSETICVLPTTGRVEAEDEVEGDCHDPST